MFKSYLKVALRNILRHKGYSFINIAGFAIGIACCLVIMVFVQHELSYDRFHDKADQIYRIALKGRLGNHEFDQVHTPAPMGPALVNDYSYILDYVRFYVPGKSTAVRYKDNLFNEDRLIYVDANFFDVFSFRLAQGDPKTALSLANSLVLTKETAAKYFGKDEAMGKMLELDKGRVYKVTGIIDKLPATSHFHFDFLASSVNIGPMKSTDWVTTSITTYIVLQKDYPYKKLEEKFPEVIRKYMGPRMKKTMGISLEQFFSAGNRLGFHLQPITDIHLHSHLEGEFGENGNIMYVYIVMLIAIFILVVACINFMNLATATSTRRAREVGIRKVLGSDRRQLIRQFLVESILMSMVAFVLAVITVYIMLPLFSKLAVRELTFSLFGSWMILPGLIAAALSVGILAGSYPAFYLSSFQPVQVLKGKASMGMRKSGLRSVLVMFQFAISIGLLICTFIVYSQFSYIQERELGFDKENLIVIKKTAVIANRLESFIHEIKQSPDIISASASSFLPGKEFGSKIFQPEGKDRQVQALNFCCTDPYFVDTLKLKMASGRYFSNERSAQAESSSAVVNKAAARAFGWSDHTGKRLRHNKDVYEVIGVLEDFHFESLHNPINPVVMLFISEGRPDFISVRANPGKIAGALKFLENQWKKFVPDKPFDYFFLEDEIEKIYRDEKRTGQLFTLFSVLSILIACLGLFSLASYTAEQRTKEIGIRKVFGASIPGIVFLLTKEFSKWILIANIAAWPAAYFAMDRWLQNFHFRTGIGIEIFIFSGFLALFIS